MKSGPSFATTAVTYGGGW